MTRFIDTLELRAEDEVLLRRHGEEAYPEEACGFLVGPTPTSGRRVVAEIVRAVNEKQDERTHRFLVNPEQFRKLEHDCESSGRSIVGIYHSHPDHPAEPSRFDLDHAWPWYAYVLVGVDRGRASAVNAFELDPDGGGWQPRDIVIPTPSMEQRSTER